MTTDRPSHYVHDPGLEADTTDDGVVVRLSGDEWVVLEGTARALWELTADPITTEDIVEALSRRYSGNRVTISADVTAALRNWTERGLLVTTTGQHDEQHDA